MPVYIVFRATAMLTGHEKLKAYYHRFEIAEDAICTCKGGDQTIDHMLLKCNNFEQRKEQIKKNYKFRRRSMAIK
jgi:hypothetical protein